jgi:hypothetical protein
MFGKHIGNLGNILGTHWELKGNIVGTHWELGKNEKKSHPCSHHGEHHWEHRGNRTGNMLLWIYYIRKASYIFIFQFFFAIQCSYNKISKIHENVPPKLFFSLKNMVKISFKP